MMATAIIIFREVLEAALVIGIVLAASRDLSGARRWIGGGVAAGIGGAGLVALFAGTIAAAAAGMGQELFNAAVLFAAVAMLGWHNVWMSRHGREMARHVTEVGRAVAAGTRPLWVLAAVVGVAVLREGSEVVLFVYGIAAGGAGSAAMLGGAAAGLAAGVAAGAAMYLGLVRLPLGALFRVTSWLILLLAAGMAAQGAGYLIQAGLVAEGTRAVWDTSGVLPEHSLVGQVLHTLIGYDDSPSGTQLVFYVTTLVVIGGAMRLWGGGVAVARGVAAGVLCALLSLPVLPGGPGVARAAGAESAPCAVQEAPCPRPGDAPAGGEVRRDGSPAAY